MDMFTVTHGIGGERQETTRSIMKLDPMEVFKALFVNLAAAKSPRLQDFLKVFGLLKRYAKLLNKDITKLDFYGDLLTNNGEMNPKLVKCVKDHYDNEGTRNSQQNKLWKLIEAELKAAESAEGVNVGLASVGLFDVSKLPAFLQVIYAWLSHVRTGPVTSDERAKLPLSEISFQLLKVLLAVTTEHKISDTTTLLQEKRGVVLALIAATVKHSLRKAVIRRFNKLRRRFGFKDEINGYTEENLPSLLKEALKIFRERAPHGFQPYKELRVQAEKYRGRGDGSLTLHTIGHYTKIFLYVASKLKLTADTSIRDLLILVSRPIEKEGIVIGTEYYNPIIEPFAEAERQTVRHGWKEANFDSVTYIRFLDALFAIARFNGEFDLPNEYRKNVKIRRDNKTRKDRKRRKKKRFHREWVDEEIKRLKSEFDTIIRRKTYAINRQHLKLCLFLPQLVVLRYLGYRQQCLRRCVVGKNIKFKKDGSVSFYYEQDEIKNGVIIDQTFSPDSCSEIPELQLLLDVLTKYYRDFLPAVRSMSPEHYDEQMGSMFFAVPSYDGLGLIKHTPFNVDSKASRDVEGNDGVSDFSYWFSQAASGLMNFSDLTDFPYNFTPHLLRGHCCDWLRKDKGWAWEEVAKAMGDREQTLKQEYFDEDEREQSAEPFAKYNERLRSIREQKERLANSVPAEALDKAQTTLAAVAEQLSEERRSRVKAEQEAATYKMRYEFALTVGKITDAEVKALIKQEQIAA